MAGESDEKCLIKVCFALRRFLFGGGFLEEVSLLGFCLAVT